MNIENLGRMITKSIELADASSETGTIITSEIFEISALNRDNKEFYFNELQWDPNQSFFELNITEDSTGKEYPYKDSERDFVIQESLSFLCDQHDSIYSQLLEEKDNVIEPFRRFELLKDIHCCADCNYQFKLIFKVDKEDLLRKWLASKGINYTQDIDLYTWTSLTKFKEQFNLLNFMKKKPKPQLLLLLSEDKLNSSGFINFVGLNSTQNRDKIKDIVENLVIKKKELDKNIEKQNKLTKKSEGIFYFPPEFWLEENTLVLSSFSESKKEIFQVHIGFLISLWQVVADKISIHENGLKFTLDREVKIQTQMHYIDQAWKLDEHELELESEQEAQQMEFYEKCIYSKYAESNYKLLRTTIILAGDESLLSIIYNTGKLIRYYSYQFENLMNDKLKEQSEVVKSLINATQALKSKLIQGIDDINKNITNVITVLLGILISYATIYGKTTSANGHEFIISVFVLFSLVYIPIHKYRVIHCIEMGNKNLTEFYNDIAIIYKIYDYDFQDMIKVKESNLLAEKKLKNAALINFLIFIIMSVVVYLFTRKLLNSHYKNTAFNGYLQLNELFWIYNSLLFVTTIGLIIYFVLQKRLIKNHK
ncbi:hypothetical protein ACN6KS_26970 [Paenibacillus nitricinens]|uniref:hypothetical protein n=1 Tax=Paenibacillus nitricinens TaxID=3367691 RepID=UPI003F864FF0